MIDYSRVLLFSGISNQELLPMLDCLGSYKKNYKSGEIIILTEDAVKSLGIILGGSVKMIKEDIWGNKTLLAVMEEGGLFGEIFTCSHAQTATVTFVAGKEAKILFLPFEKIWNSCTTSCACHHKLMGNLISLLADKNVQLIEKLEVTTKKSVREKISCFLSIQAQKNNSRYFTVNMGRMELSEFLCVNRSALTRELNQMRSEGLIDFDRNTFKIIKDQKN